MFPAGPWSSLTSPLPIFPFCSPHLLLLLLIACGHQQEFRDKVALSRPHLSWPPWKVYPPISYKSWGKSFRFRLLSHLSEKGQNSQYKRIQWGQLQRQEKCNTHSVRTKWGSNLETFSGEFRTLKRDDHTEDAFSPTIFKRFLLRCLARFWSLDLWLKTGGCCPGSSASPTYIQYPSHTDSSHLDWASLIK